MARKICGILFFILSFGMFASVMAVLSFAEETVPKTNDVKAVFNTNFYVKANETAGLTGDVTVAIDSVGCIGTLYLPGSADPSQLFLSWDDNSITVSIDGAEYESGTVPVAAAESSKTIKITSNYAFAFVTIKTVKGSADVDAMFINLDESMGTIDAMNSDEAHETSCFGGLTLDGISYFVSIKGRGNSTWKLDKRPYNLTFYKKADYNKKQSVSLIENGEKAKKWSLLANHYDGSLMRNKIAMDLASSLGIGLDTKFVDVWMNGEYLGNYLLTQKNDYNVSDSGYFLENDNYIDTKNAQFKIPGMFEFHDVCTDSGYYNRITIKNIGDDAREAGVDETAVEDYFLEAWNALLDYDSELYQNYFDMDSWAKMYLMYEVSKVYDCFSGSLLMHRDGLTVEDKLIAGPVWDCDNAFGRTLQKFIIGMTMPIQFTAEGWFTDSIGQVAIDRHYSLLQELEKHPSFMKCVSEVYNEYRYAFEDVAADVDYQATILEDSALMNNVKWGTNHLNSGYYVAPFSMGTGDYILNYEVTLEWQNYVNNLKEYCTKRVMWLSDHLYADIPVGEITQSVNKTDNTVVLKANLTTGNDSNTYRWQNSKNGKKWSDVAGADSARLVLSAKEATAGLLYRCIVTNEGVAINMTHVNGVKASVKTTLAAVSVNATRYIETKEITIQNGTLTFVMNDRDMGDFAFSASGRGWTIMNENGKYLAVIGSSFTYSDSPFVWSYDNGVFSAKVKVSKTAIGRWLGIGSTKTAYLTTANSAFAVSLDNGTSAKFLQTTEVPILK